MSQAGIISVSGSSGIVESVTGSGSVTATPTTGDVVVGLTGITEYNVLVGGATNTINDIAPSTAGYVLTSNGASSAPSFQAASSGGIVTIDGDSGSITGSTVTIYADNAANNCGSSVSFVNSGTLSTLNVSDSNGNTFVGNNAGTSDPLVVVNTGFGVNALFGVAGNFNTAIGNNCLAGSVVNDYNTGSGCYCLKNLGNAVNNSGYGYNTLNNLETGSFNTAIDGGSAYTSRESSNVLIRNSGVEGENNVVRIGSQGNGEGEQDECFIAGITGVTNSNPAIVTLNTSTGQLGDDTTNFNILSTGLQLKGNNAATAPPTGYIGEQITSGFVSGVSLVNSTAKTVASITLTPGIWDISCISAIESTLPSIEAIQVGISTTTNSFTGVNFGDSGFASYIALAAGVATNSGAVPAYRQLVSTNTTYFLVDLAIFGTGTVTAAGRISAVRIG